MKIIPAIFAALIITSLVGVAIFVVGANALFNQNTLPILNAPQTVSGAAAAAGAAGSAGTAGNAAVSQQTGQQAQLQQLENLVQQYQQREKQYQTQLNDAAQRVNQANQQVQQYQQLLEALQQQGVIRITADGQVLIPRSRGFDDGGFFGGNN